MSTTLYAQKEYTPEDTEVWKPVPKVVAPGAQDDQPPADAIVLFDGITMDAWEMHDSTTWTVHDGMVTIEPSLAKQQMPTSIYIEAVVWRHATAH